MSDAERSRKSAPTWAVIAILSLCGTVVALQQTMVIPLLPDFPAILGVSADDASWLVTATLLSSAVATPIMSRLADMFGKRLMMVVCMIAMTAGSVLAALGGNYLTVIVGRALQGFAAALIPIGISIMRDELPKEKVGSAVALMSATLGIGAALGLPLSGIIFEQFGWQAIFWTSAAAGVLLIVGVLLLVSESTVRTKGRFDFVGALLLSIALTALLLGISKGGSWGWASQQVIGLFLVTAVVIALWVPYELKVGQPLVDLRTSARRPVLLTNIASVLVGFAMFANLLLTTQQLQLPTATGYGFGLSVIIAGLAMVPSGLAMVAFAPVSGRMINRYGGRITLITGSAVMAVAYIARVYYSNTVLAVIIGSTVVSIGTAIAYAAMPTLIMASVPITETASANGLNALLRALGTSSSSAAVAAVLGSVTIQLGPAKLPSLTAFQDVFWMAGLGALAGCAVAWYIPAARRATVGEPDLLETGALGVTPAGENKEIVVHGRVLQLDQKPAHPAVVTVLTTDGCSVDWTPRRHRREILGGAARTRQVPGAGQRARLGAARRGLRVPRRNNKPAHHSHRSADDIGEGHPRRATDRSGTGHPHRGDRRGGGVGPGGSRGWVLHAAAAGRPVHRHDARTGHPAGDRAQTRAGRAIRRHRYRRAGPGAGSGPDPAGPGQGAAPAPAPHRGRPGRRTVQHRAVNRCVC